ncbi:unnamed protein product [Trichogramma brassicae]|uniref:Uncharacterized protein n=1 Tax=Trichogramma brassicae TaxID=86971 RepID=A0A6H5ISK9_9HYME|nr:unnamed protein product [Trichogramma brassicae]
MRTFAGSRVSDDALRVRWLELLPEQTRRLLLLTWNQSLDELAAVADEAHAMGPSVMSIGYRSQQPTSAPSLSFAADSPDPVTQKLAELLLAINLIITLIHFCHSSEAQPRSDRLGKLSHPCSRDGCALQTLLKSWSHGRLLQGSRPHRALLSMRPEEPSSKGLQRPTIVRSLPRTRSRRPSTRVHKLELPSCTEDNLQPLIMRILQLNFNHCEAASRTCFTIPSASCASTWPSCVSNTRTLLHPIHSSPMPTVKQLSGCREEFRCRSAWR